VEPRRLTNMLQLNARRIRPQPFQVIKPTHRLIEDVYHHISKIEQHPPSALKAFTGDWREPMLCLQALQDRLSYRTYMPPIGSIANDKIVAIGNATTKIKNHEFFSLLFVGKLGHEVSEGQRVANGNLLVLGEENKKTVPGKLNGCPSGNQNRMATSERRTIQLFLHKCGSESSTVCSRRENLPLFPGDYRYRVPV